MDELTRAIVEIKSTLVALDQKLDRRFDAVDGRFDALEGRFETRFAGLETRTSHWFLSMLTLQIMTLLAIIGGLFGIVAKLI
jgi:hypothetical protein